MSSSRRARRIRRHKRHGKPSYPASPKKGHSIDRIIIDEVSDWANSYPGPFVHEHVSSDDR